jgi:hypothetical protein
MRSDGTMKRRNEESRYVTNEQKKPIPMNASTIAWPVTYQGASGERVEGPDELMNRPAVGR